MRWRCLAWLRLYRPNEAELKLANAYRSVFGKDGENTEIVLADLAAHTGFYMVEPPGADLSQFQAGYNAGQRAAFGRLFQFLTLSDEQMRALEVAARQEAEQI